MRAHHSLPVDGAAGGHLGRMHLLAAVKDGSLVICAHTFEWPSVFISPESRSGLDYLGSLASVKS